ncbi:hypothetical protein OUZ56_004001 [Daphnia magna]|uniref:Uncharacterized protein n=1 Tax=Daphnia magna TaxID=35525 RepID=A0ABQ9YNG3_9CRUS|nr:hypothetical protein OUZ56_004001 [Daphnia magna]
MIIEGNVTVAPEGTLTVAPLVFATRHQPPLAKEACSEVGNSVVRQWTPRHCSPTIWNGGLVSHRKASVSLCAFRLEQGGDSIVPKDLAYLAPQYLAMEANRHAINMISGFDQRCRKVYRILFQETKPTFAIEARHAVSISGKLHHDSKLQSLLPSQVRPLQYHWFMFSLLA